MLEALNYIIGTVQLFGLLQEITKTSPTEPAVRAANYVAAGVEVYILLGLRLQPQLQKCSPNAYECNSNLGEDHLLA